MEMRMNHKVDKNNVIKSIPLVVDSISFKSIQHMLGYLFWLLF